jgi:hypothetical protein
VKLTGLKPGKHSFSVAFDGSYEYRPTKSKAATVTVAKHKPTLTLSAKPGKAGKATLTVKLSLPGKAAKSTKATLKVYDGKKLLKQTVKVSKGKGTVTLKSLKKGTHTFTVSYAGNSSYVAKSVTAKATVK